MNVAPHHHTTGSLARWHRWIMGALCIAVLALALGVRLHQLNSTSFWHDELQSACWAARYSIPELMQLGPPPLHTVLLRVVSAGGRYSSQLLYRLVSVALGLWAVWLMYVMARRLGGRGLGIAAALLLAVSAYHIWHSQQARYYVAVIAFITACAERIVCWREQRSWRAALGAAAAAAGAVLAHYYAAIALPGLALFAVTSSWRKPNSTAISWRRHVAITFAQLAAAALLFLALISTGLTSIKTFARFYANNMSSLDGSSQNILKRELPRFPHITQVRERLNSWYFGPVSLPTSVYSRETRPEAVWYFALCAAGATAGLAVRRTRPAGWLVLATLASVVYVQAMISSSIFNNRYVSAGVPFYLLGAANGCLLAAELLSWVLYMALRLLRPRAASLAFRLYLVDYGALAAALPLALVSFSPHARQAAYCRSMLDCDWRAIGEFIRQHSGPRIVLHAPHKRLSKCPYMYLTGVARRDVDYVAERDILLRRAVYEVATTPFHLWLQDASPRVTHAPPAVIAQQVGPFYLTGIRHLCSNYSEAFAILASVDPSWQTQSQALLAELRSLPPRAALDAGTPDARPYLARGWSADEQQGNVSYVWSYDEEAAVLVPAQHGPSFDIHLHLRASKSGRVDLYGNAVFLTNWTASPQWHYVSFYDLPNFLTADVNFISFVPHFLRRRDYEEFQHDHRQLGVALNTLRIASSLQRLLPPSRAIFVADPRHEAILGSGWSHPESWNDGALTMRWLDGTRASLRVSIPSNTTCHSLIIRCVAFLPPNTPPTTLAVSINGVHTLSQQLSSSWQDVSLPLPSNAPYFDIMLTASAAYRPSDYGMGTDERLLSIGVEKISFQP